MTRHDPDHALPQALQLAKSLAPVDAVARLAVELAARAGHPVARPVPDEWIRKALSVLVAEAHAVQRCMSDIPTAE